MTGEPMPERMESEVLASEANETPPVIETPTPATPEPAPVSSNPLIAAQNIGQWSIRSLVLLGVIVVGLIIGAIAYYTQFTQGEVVTGMRDVGAMGGAAWGLYISMAVYFIGISFAGVTVSALVRIFRIEALKPIRRIAEVLTVISLMLGAMAIMVDLGQPFRGLINLPQYARPMSPFFGTFTLVISGYLFASLVFLYLSGRRDAAVMAKEGGKLTWFYNLWSMGYQDTTYEHARHEKTSFWLSLAILPLLVVAHSTLGFIFGIQSGRPGWFNGLQAPSFVVLAGVSGIGALIFLTALFGGMGRGNGSVTERTYKWLGNFLWVGTAVYLYLMIVEAMTALYAAPAAERAVAEAIMFGGYYGPWYWTAVALFGLTVLLGFIMMARNKWNVGILLAMGVFVNAAAIIKRYLIVVPSQTIGTLLPYEVGSYQPTWVEFGVLIGIVAFGGLLYLVFIKMFPAFTVAPPSKDHWETPEGLRKAYPMQTGRRIIFFAALGLGLALAITGLFLSAPLGPTDSEVISDPKVPFAPTIFIIGVIVMFLSPVIYELKADPKGVNPELPA